MAAYVIGVDFGTLSARALLLDVVSGTEVAESVFEYPHGVISNRLGQGELPPKFALQHPGDYLQALGHTVKGVMAEAGIGADEVKGIGVDFTTCTILPLDEENRPLCLDPRFAEEPHAYVKLWKHHGAAQYADRLTQSAKLCAPQMLVRYGGKLSFQWMFPKIMEVLQEAPDVFNVANRFAEAGDWITAQLTGRETHSLSFAGYKACFDPDAGYPEEAFLTEADPRLAGIIGTKVSKTVDPVCTIAGCVDGSGAELTGLAEGTPVAVAMPDAHVALPALNITEDRKMMLILGTSICHLINSSQPKEVPGVCGCIKDGVIPGHYTYEAGQPSCGDALDVFIEHFTPAEYRAEAAQRNMTLHQLYIEKASALRIGQSGLIVLDWFNGNRSTLNDSDLSGMLLGLTLHTRPEEIYRALLEGCAFGSRMIIENFEEHGVQIDSVVASGGIAMKNGLMMQIYADVIGKPVSVAGSVQASARGSALYAAVAAGLYPDIRQAAMALAIPDREVYEPCPDSTGIYEEMYREYRKLYRYFGKENLVMHRLRAMKHYK